MLNSQGKGSFISLFSQIAKSDHPYKIWSDIMVMYSIALENAVLKSPEKEEQYLAISNKYDRDRLQLICKLMAVIVEMLEECPTDVLGQLYMELEIGNKNSGQFFTPPELSLAIAKLSTTDLKQQLESREFIKILEPACGAGGMILAFIDLITKAGFNPAQKVWVHATDVDPIVARMCHIQLSLWNVPATIVIGNSLTLKIDEILYTPAYYLGLWQQKSKREPRWLIDDHTEQEPINLYAALKNGDISFEEYQQMKL